MNKTLTALVLATGILATGCKSCSTDEIIGHNTGIIATPIRVLYNDTKKAETCGILRFACDTKTGRDFVTVKDVNKYFIDEAVGVLNIGDSIAYPIYEVINEHSITTKYNNITILKHTEK